MSIRAICLRQFLALAAAPFFALAADSNNAPPQSAQGLMVAPDGHSLLTMDGKPFYWLGDTAWNLFYALEDNEVAEYAAARQAQGFNVALVQLVGGDILAVDRRGRRSMIIAADGSGRLDSDFAQSARDKVRVLNQNGLVAGLVLTWQNIIKQRLGSPYLAHQFGLDVGRALGDVNVIWLLGGDINPDETSLTLYRAVAQGLIQGSSHRHLVSFHPAKGSSSQWFADDSVISFHSVQSGHSRYRPLASSHVKSIREDYARVPAKPVVDLESGYEGIPDGLYRLHPKGTDVAEKDRLDEYDIRVRAWQQYMSGSLGYTYGQLDVMILWENGGTQIWPIHQPWRTQLNKTGARQMKIYQTVRGWVGSPYLVPDDGLVVQDMSRIYDNARTLGGCAPHRDTCLIYSAPGMPFTVPTTRAGAGTRLSWIDPRTGAKRAASGQAGTGGIEFTPPGQAFLPKQGERSMNDWLLLIERF